MDHIKYAHTQKAFKDALEEVMRPYKGQALTPQSRAEIKKKAIAVTRKMIPAHMDTDALDKFIDGVLDLGAQS